MMKFVLAAAAAIALWTGSAHAEDNVADKPAQASEQQQLAYATTTRGQVSIYPSFRNGGNAQGGEQ